MFAPVFANAEAISSPMPSAASVTIATLLRLLILNVSQARSTLEVGRNACILDGRRILSKSQREVTSVRPGASPAAKAPNRCGGTTRSVRAHEHKVTFADRDAGAFSYRGRCIDKSAGQ